MRRDARLSTTTATGKSVFNHHHQAVHIFVWAAASIRLVIQMESLKVNLMIMMVVLGVSLIDKH